MLFKVLPRVLISMGALVLLLAIPLAHAESFSGRVVGVADGDTVTVLDASMVQHKVRLSGIDAPEKSQPFGQRSKESLSELVFGRWVFVESEKRDRYGREVGKIFKDGLDTNLEQIRRGFAWHYKAYAQEQSEQDRGAYAVAEELSRFNKSGLWRDSEPTPPWEYRRTNREQRSRSSLGKMGD